MRRLMLLALLLSVVPGCTGTAGTRLEGQSCFGTAECAPGLLCDTSQGAGICAADRSQPPPGPGPDALPSIVVDASEADAALPDAALPDAALPDAALPDAALPDAMM